MQSSTPGYPLWSSSIVARLVGLRRSLVRNFKSARRARPSPSDAAKFAAVVEEGRPASSPLLHECLDLCRGAAVGVAGQQFGGEPGAPVLGRGRQDLGPVHAGGLELPGPHVMPQRRLSPPAPTRISRLKCPWAKARRYSSSRS